MPTGSMSTSETSLTSETLPQSNGDTSLEGIASPLAAEIEEILLKGFGSRFTVIDGNNGQVLFEAPDQPARDWALPA